MSTIPSQAYGGQTDLLGGMGLSTPQNQDNNLLGMFDTSTQQNNATSSYCLDGMMDTSVSGSLFSQNSQQINLAAISELDSERF